MTHPYPLLARIGLELEYMIVDRRTLDVRPIADRLLHAVSGSYDGEVPLGPVSWSNELTLHVLELKTTDPVPSLDGAPGLFQDHVGRANAVLAPLGACLLPTAMHPWMDPLAEMRLWPHDHGPIYGCFDRIFSCRGHGWANLQASHINLSFGTDAAPADDFGRLHAAVRLLLPLLPALAASSPVLDGHATGILDNRLAAYRANAARVPSVAGRVIPEPVFTRDDYQRVILDRIYADLAPLDPEGILRHEWANSRGAIARFERGSIEIRLLDVQECPRADVAIGAAVIGALRALVEERSCTLAVQQAWAAEPLACILDSTTRDGDRALITDRAYLDTLGFPDPAPCAAGEVWAHLIETCLPRREREDHHECLRVILERGPLARRILAAAGPAPGRDRLRSVYTRLADCLRHGEMFLGAD